MTISDGLQRAARKLGWELSRFPDQQAATPEPEDVASDEATTPEPDDAFSMLDEYAVAAPSPQLAVDIFGGGGRQPCPRS